MAEHIAVAAEVDVVRADWASCIAAAVEGAKSFHVAEAGKVGWMTKR